MPDELIEFYGTECPHCKDMEPLIAKLEKETGKKVKRFEVWHDAENAKLMQRFDPDGSRCGGVPFFFNKKSGEWICGSTSYEKFKAWAAGK
ncbi:MAG: thioredoxin family protein [Candidatus Aenigmarchaeota archaeon]|nr:thioredoxin family protein [Candidatus Aenigmarchaeota archaeon]